MALYERKPIDHSFVIICVDNSPGLLKTTVASLDNHHAGTARVCVANSSASKNEIDAMGAAAPLVVGGSTVTSLVNEGVSRASAEWVFIVYSGSVVRQRIDEKFSAYIDSERDVLFPIANRKTDFVEGTMNGMLVNRKTFLEVGPMPELESLEMSKAFWAYEAIGMGCRFKAIVGGKIC